jgi:hypothetical protein
VLSVRVARLTATPWATVYHEWPAGLVLALAVVLLTQDREAARTREAERRDLAMLVAYGFHEPKRLQDLPPIERPTRAQVQAHVAEAAARLASAPPELAEG